MAFDQVGCRAIQDKLADHKVAVIDGVVENSFATALVHNILALGIMAHVMTNQFGNYLV